MRVWLASNSDLVGTARAEALLARYGTRATEIIDYIVEKGDVQLTSSVEYSRTEIEYLVTQESVVHLPDLLLRRTSLAFTGSITAALLEELADVMAQQLNWDAETRDAEVRNTRTMLATAHLVTVPEVAAAQ
jgi:glycerol-3-phosphate dehydrogenase